MHPPEEDPFSVPPYSHVAGDGAQHDDTGATKLWAVYINEAEKSDRALAESWKSDMEGILIFSGLFTASLTAFIIESYRGLGPNSGDQTVALLSQISQQLAAAAQSGSTPTIASTTPTPLVPVDVPFVAPTSTLLCNTLWFTSLGFSLSGALLALLIDQWARQFLRRSGVHSGGNTARARRISYIYFGVHRFKMRHVVEIVPQLLHVALFLFFAGLVAFLWDINGIMTIISATILCLLLASYTGLTMLPVFYPDSPYKTPLSGVLWEIFKMAPWPNAAQKFGTLANAIFEAATMPSDDLNARDVRSLSWTVRSLKDDAALEPFVEGIPDLLWGPNGKRHDAGILIMPLLERSDVRLGSRIQSMLRECENILHLDIRARRQIVCLKAIWAITHFFDTGALKRPRSFLFDAAILDSQSLLGNKAVEYHLASTRALVRWQQLSSITESMTIAHTTLNECTVSGADGRLKNLQTVVGCCQVFQRLINQLPESIHPPGFTDLLVLMNTVPRDVQSGLAWKRNIADKIQHFQADIHSKIMIDFMRSCATLEFFPYQFESTCIAGKSQGSPPSTTMTRELEETVISVASALLTQDPADQQGQLLDGIIRVLLSFWHPPDRHISLLPKALISYINFRENDDILRKTLEMCSSQVLSLSIATYLAEGHPERSLEETLQAIWRLCVLRWNYPIFDINPKFKPFLAEFDESTLQAVRRLPESPASPSTAAMIQHTILDQLSEGTSTRHDLTVRLSNPILPPVTCADRGVLEISQNSDEVGQYHVHIAVKQALAIRRNEATLVILTEFLEACSKDPLPFNTLETATHITECVISPPLHKSHQTRFVSSLKAVMDAPMTPARLELAKTVISSNIFMPYAQHSMKALKYLDDTVARQSLTAALTQYVQELHRHRSSPSLVDRIQKIIQELHAPDSESSTGVNNTVQPEAVATPSTHSAEITESSSGRFRFMKRKHK
ncbi:hypothetical protein FB451DRAFT_1206344 [Mycena latifolia]|nr:hypothetical protein FB451DRAFT_1206344 [Mycena latifolia]